jgi:hypothetical protein
MRNHLWLLVCFLFTIAALPSFCSVQDDSTTHDSNIQQVQFMRFDQKIINEFKEDADFMYTQPPGSRPNFLKVLWNKFFQWLVFIFGNEAFAWLVLILLIIAGVVGLGFAFYGIFGIGKTIPIYSGDVNGLDYEVKAENIHELNFVEEIDLAVEQQDFKRAVRLMYLHALKLLADKDLIDWLPAKTNHDYMYEIKNELYKKQFSTLSYFFEYVWYGDFQADATQFGDMKNVFSGLKQSLQQHGKN